MSIVNYKEQNILFYDDECGICSHWIQFVLINNINNNWFFCSLENGLKYGYLNNATIKDKQSMIALINGKLFYRSIAFFNIGKDLRYPYKLLSILKIFPRFLKDGIYDIISRHRTKIAAKQCSSLNKYKNRIIT